VSEPSNEFSDLAQVHLRGFWSARNERTISLDLNPMDSVGNIPAWRRKKAAYPTRYEFPDCPECKKLKDAMVNARYDVSSFRAPDPQKSRSRWPKDYQNEMYNLECHANLTKAEYELHLFSAHDDKTYEGSAMANLAIVARNGRLKP
jgi:hypothetical protein